MPLMQITVVPLGTGSPSVGDYVADIEHFLQKKGVEHSLHDMGTIIAGSTSELLLLAEELHCLPFTRGATRVVTTITLDERSDKEPGLGGKQQSVHQKIQEKKGL